jgi:hypothetical protein
VTKKEEGRGELRKLYSAELHDLCPSPDTLQVITSSRMKGAGLRDTQTEGKKCQPGFGGQS